MGSADEVFTGDARSQAVRWMLGRLRRATPDAQVIRAYLLAFDARWCRPPMGVTGVERLAQEGRAQCRGLIVRQ